MDLPASLFGVPLKVKAVETCSAPIGAGSQPSITRTVLYDTQAASSDLLLNDTTARTEGACYTVTLPSPAALQGTLSLRLLLSFPDTVQSFDFTRLSVTMTP
jgi:hypothetical protein